MNTMAGHHAVQVDARVEFYGNPAIWPRGHSRYLFLGDVVQEVGWLTFGAAWTGSEPRTELLGSIRPTLDATITTEECRAAAEILYESHSGYRERAIREHAAGRPLPMPNTDEWPIAHAISQQRADDALVAFRRYRNVTEILMTLFELGIIIAVRRPYIAGEPFDIPRGDWFNEIYPAWFATCQINPEQPFSRVACRFGGDWIYVEATSYYSWRATVTRPARPPTPSGPAKPNGGSESQATSEPHVSSTARPRSERQRSAGAKPQYEWADFEGEALTRARSDSPPKSVRAFAVEMLAWWQAKTGHEPAESTLRARLTKLMDDNGLVIGNKKKPK